MPEMFTIVFDRILVGTRAGGPAVCLDIRKLAQVPESLPTVVRRN